MPSTSRTAEFRSCVESIRLRSAAPAPASSMGKKGGSGRTEFARQAAEIGKEIEGTMGKLEKLAQCEGFLLLFSSFYIEMPSQFG
jgi:syntaxin 5